MKLPVAGRRRLLARRAAPAPRRRRGRLGARRLRRGDRPAPARAADRRRRDALHGARAHDLLRGRRRARARRGRRRHRVRPARRTRRQRVPRDRDRGRRPRRSRVAGRHGRGRRPAHRPRCRAELGEQGGQRPRPAHGRAAGRPAAAGARVRTGLAVDAIRAVLSQHVRHLLLADVGVRRDLPDSVHQMRVAARRLRSALATFAPLLQAEQALDPARGAQVDRQRARGDPRHRGHARAARPPRRAARRRGGHRARPRGHRPAARAAPVGRPVERARGPAQRPPPAARRRPHVGRDRSARDRRRLRDVRGPAAPPRLAHLAAAAQEHRGPRDSTGRAPRGTPRGSRRSAHATRRSPSRRSSART